MIIKHNLKLNINLVLLCIIFRSVHLLRNNVVRKKTGIIIKLDKLVIPSLDMILFLINYTAMLEEKYVIPLKCNKNTIHCRQLLYLGFTKYL
jgi:hypothetical protein